jgi:serine/threonine protein kinase
MCHGGIKPSNIFLCEGDRVMLGDPCLPPKGIGIAMDRLSYDYRYAPPEMFLASGVVGPRSDFYALGCVAYELLCGAPPFVSDSFHELASKHIHDPIALPLQGGIPLGARTIILKLLARSPAERYSTLPEVLQALTWLEEALKESASEGVFQTPPVARDVSIMNYQGGQSILNFEQTGGPLSEALRTGPSDPTASEESPLQIPGYEILTELGRGGMGRVYQARDVHLNRVVALKVLPAGPSVASETLARFRSEGQAVARLQHANIVQIYGLIEHEGRTCLVLEYVGGGTLQEKLRTDGESSGPMPIHEAATLTATLARAVEFAHRHGILHRDLKPSNILFTSEGQPKIVDFGLAKQLRESPDAAMQTRVGEVLGTPAYMAPEQARGDTQQVGPPSDVYALGTILYEMLTARLPFKWNNRQDLLLRIQAENPTPPSHLRREIPRDLDTICLKCLEKEPALRYGSAAALADDLDRYLAGQRIAAGPPSIWRRLARLLPFRRSSKDPQGSQSPDT